MKNVGQDGVQQVFLTQITDACQHFDMKGSATRMAAGEKMNVGFNFAARRAETALSRITSMKGRASGENAVGELDNKVKAGGIGGAQFAKNRPVDGIGSGCRPILRRSNVG